MSDLEPAQRDYFLGMVVFIVVHMISRIFYMLYDFYYINGSPYVPFWDIGAAIGAASVVFLLFAIERHMLKKTKYLFTILSIITVVLYFVIYQYRDIVQLIMIPIVAIVVPLIYVYTAIKSTGQIRKTSIIIAIGIIIFILGQAAHSINVWDIFTENIAFGLYYIISPIGLTLGGLSAVGRKY
ncbi:MAG: hypothetical protein GF329_05875 [Candidatus Lokiarchaeota archaeon]|nr:hypothetical protein [Candidatus Lokiarchaeota archaeon]